ncbi:MAG: PHP domain-containing protein [Rhodococcus sp. (in: high G+C Gram-positive bacteria)]
MLIDLHTHSTSSDGTDSPAELIAAATAAGLDVVALTDHDTTHGWAEAEAAVLATSGAPSLVRGMEMSCEGRGEDGDPVTVHLLAYLFDPANAALANERQRLRDERVTRLRTMIGLMKDDGYDVDADAIIAAAGPSAGRPHLAAALVSLGVVDTIGDAFTDLLKTGGKYYATKRDTPLDEAVGLIADAGGVPVIAHSRARTRGRLLHVEHIEELARGGQLGGLEVDHPDHTARDADLLRAIADEHGLLITGSSDYHGSNKTTPIGARTTAQEQYERLVEASSGVPVIEAHR